MNLLSNDIAIDFGTCNTRIYIKGKGLVLDEPSVIAFDNESGEIIATGFEALSMLGKAPSAISVTFPLIGGVISDPSFAEELLKSLLRKVCPKTFLKPRIFMSVPATATNVESRAFRDAAILAGARSVYIMKSTIAAAIGSKCDVLIPRGLMVANLGGGVSEFSTISAGQIASAHTSKTAGGTFTDSLTQYFQNSHSLLIGYPTAEKCKKEIGGVFPRETKAELEVCGIDTNSGMPKKITVSQDDVKDALIPVATKLAEDFKTAVDAVPSELLGDILEDGILLTGAGANLFGLVQKLQMDTELKLFLAPQSEYAVIRGLATIIENIKVLSEDLYTIYHS